jgi:hypothetical protein
VCLPTIYCLSYLHEARQHLKHDIHPCEQTNLQYGHGPAWGLALTLSNYIYVGICPWASSSAILPAAVIRLPVKSISLRDAFSFKAFDARVRNVHSVWRASRIGKDGWPLGKHSLPGHMRSHLLSQALPDMRRGISAASGMFLKATYHMLGWAFCDPTRAIQPEVPCSMH